MLPARISRRRFLAGAAVASVGLPRPSPAETAADRIRVVRATAAGYDGAVPGPALRLKRGEELAVRLVNELTAPTTIHWHGVRLANAMDGVTLLTQPSIMPGASFDYRFRPPDAGTFWYHAPAGEQIDRGLCGALIVEESVPVTVDRDVVLVLGMPDDTDKVQLRVNGAVRPDIPVKRGERLRLRLINATAARGVAVKLDGHAPWVMAIDAQPAEPFRARDGRAGLPPGGRADLFVDMVRDPGTTTPILAGGRDGEPIARLAYESGEAAPIPLRADPPALPPNPLPGAHRSERRAADRIDASEAKAVRSGIAADLQRHARTRGHACDPQSDRPIPDPAPAWAFVPSARPARRRLEAVLADTLVAGGDTERVAFVADNPGKWLIEWRPIEQPQASAGVWFAVT